MYVLLVELLVELRMVVGGKEPLTDDEGDEDVGDDDMLLLLLEALLVLGPVLL